MIKTSKMNYNISNKINTIKIGKIKLQKITIRKEEIFNKKKIKLQPS